MPVGHQNLKKGGPSNEKKWDNFKRKREKSSSSPFFNIRCCVIFCFRKLPFLLVKKYWRTRTLSGSSMSQEEHRAAAKGRVSGKMRGGETWCRLGVDYGKTVPVPEAPKAKQKALLTKKQKQKQQTLITKRCRATRYWAVRLLLSPKLREAAVLSTRKKRKGEQTPPRSLPRPLFSQSAREVQPAKLHREKITRRAFAPSKPEHTHHILK